MIHVDYSCAWQRDILAQGRMYISSNYLCFYANILNWKSTLELNFKEISSITREKTAKVISNAIEVRTEKGEKYFFASFVTRDKTFGIIEKIWNAARQDQVKLRKIKQKKNEKYKISACRRSTAVEHHPRELRR